MVTPKNRKATVLTGWTVVVSVQAWGTPRETLDPTCWRRSAGELDKSVILFRLRTHGHNRMNAHMFNKLQIGQTDRCPCDTAPMTTQHLLQDCPLHDVVRQEAWPEDPPLRDRLYGNPAALQRTAAYVRGTGVFIWAIDDEEGGEEVWVLFFFFCVRSAVSDSHWDQCCLELDGAVQILVSFIQSQYVTHFE